jgi:8-oxo-dGTP diphosphatase
MRRRRRGGPPVSSQREYPERPVVGVGGVVVADERALIIRRGSEPLKGEWSIPGGMLEVGETLAAGVARELREETGLQVKVLDLIEVFERIFPGVGAGSRPRYHFVILDYLCEPTGGELKAGSDVTDVAWVREEELEGYGLSIAATRVLKKAYAMAGAQTDSKK